MKGESDFSQNNAELWDNSSLLISLHVSSDSCLLPAQSFGLDPFDCDHILTIMNVYEYILNLILTNKYYNLDKCERRSTAFFSNKTNDFSQFMDMLITQFIAMVAVVFLV